MRREMGPSSIKQLMFNYEFRALVWGRVQEQAAEYCNEISLQIEFPTQQQIYPIRIMIMEQVQNDICNSPNT